MHALEIWIKCKWRVKFKIKLELNFELNLKKNTWKIQIEMNDGMKMDDWRNI